MSFREATLPRHLTEDLVTFSDLDDCPPYSIEASRSELAVAERLREVLLAVAAGDIEYDPPEILAALNLLEEEHPEAQVLLYNLESEHPADIEDLDQLLDEIVEAVRSES